MTVIAPSLFACLPSRLRLRNAAPVRDARVCLIADKDHESHDRHSAAKMMHTLISWTGSTS